MKINLNRIIILTILLMTTINSFSQLELNTVGPSSRYEGYYKSFQEENLFGNAKSVKKFAQSNKNYHSILTDIELSDTLMRDFWYELNLAQEIVSVSSPKSTDIFNWKAIFKNKKYIEGWRNKNNSFQLTNSYTYTNTGLVQKIVDNTYSYEEIRLYYYKDNVAFKSESIAQGYKAVEEWTEEDDGTYSIVKYLIDPDNNKVYQHLTRFMVSENNVTEIRLNAGQIQNPRLEDLTNKYFIRALVLNDNNQIIEESITWVREEPSTIVHKYGFDKNGNQVYHEQNELDKNEKSVWTTELNDLGQKIKSNGSKYKNNDLQYKTENIYKYDEYGNIKSEYQTGSHHKFEYTYDSRNNWTIKKYFIDNKLFEIQYREIEYFD